MLKISFFHSNIFSQCSFRLNTCFMALNRLCESICRISVYITSISLFRSRNNADIDYLPLSGRVIAIFQKCVKLYKQFVNQLGLYQLMPKEPNYFDIRHPIAQTELQKTHQRQTIKNFEHQNNVIGFYTGIALPLFVSNRFKSRTKLFPVDEFIKLKKRIIIFVQITKSIVPVKKTCLQNNTPGKKIVFGNQFIFEGKIV